MLESESYEVVQEEVQLINAMPTMAHATVIHSTRTALLC